MMNWFKKPSQGQIILNWALAIIWLVLIFWSSSFSAFPVLGEQATPADYELVSSIVHVILYGVLTFLLIRALVFSGLNIKKAMLLGFLIAVVYGATDEWHQVYVPGREARLADWLLDVLGSWVILTFYYYQIRKGKIK